MPYHKKPKQKKFIGGMLKRAIKKRGGSRGLSRMVKRVTTAKRGKPKQLGNLISPAARKKAAVKAAARKATRAKNMSRLSADQRNLLGQAQSGVIKRGGHSTQAIADMTKKYGTTKAAAATGRKLSAKRAAARKAAAKAKPKSNLSAAQKALLGSVQREAKKRGAGAITSKMVELTKKHGDHSSTKTAAKKATTQRRASSATTKAAKAKAEAMRRMRGRSGARVKRGRVYSTTTGAARAKALAAAKKRAAAAKRRRGGVLSRAKRVIAGRTTSKRRRPTTSTSRRRRSPIRRAIASTRRGRSVLSRTRRGRPVTRRRRVSRAR